MAVSDAGVAVAAFEGGFDLVVGHVEFGTPVEEFFYEFGAFADDEIDDGVIVDGAAGGEGIFYVGFEGIGGVEYGGDGPELIKELRIGELGFAGEDDVAVAGGFYGGAEACDTGAEDEDVCEELASGGGIDVCEVSSYWCVRIGHGCFSFKPKYQEQGRFITFAVGKRTCPPYILQLIIYDTAWGRGGKQLLLRGGEGEPGDG